MSLMKDGLWGIVNETEAAPADAATADVKAKYNTRKDRALATIVLSIEPSLLYLLGDPNDPVTVWKTLSNQFQRKTWANKLVLRRKLHSMKLTAGNSVQEHVKCMTEVFNELAVVGVNLDEEDKVIYLLASLPESYNTLVTALEANKDVPTMEIVLERLLHEERKLLERETTDTTDKAMTTTHKKPKKGPKCHYCHKFGHIQRNCLLKQKQEVVEEVTRGSKQQPNRVSKTSSYKANTIVYHESDPQSDSENTTEPIVQYALSVGEERGMNNVPPSQWIVDSGATAHIGNCESLFNHMMYLDQPQHVTLGDGRTLDIKGRGDVTLNVVLPDGKRHQCVLKNVLLVPNLGYNLLSVAKAVEAGKEVQFRGNHCYIIDERDGGLIISAEKVNGLYHVNVNCNTDNRINTLLQSSNKPSLTKEAIWHRRLGHLNLGSLRKLAQSDMVIGFDYDPEKATEGIGFCESCVEGKSHRLPFQPRQGKQSNTPLELVHSDVCGKLNIKSLGGAQYFLTFIDDSTRYVWIYVLKRKDEVFTKFCEWKAMVENSTGCKLKTLRSDNGGEYTSAEFTDYLKREGIRHELTIPRTPEQNGVAERMNRTLVEMVRSMLSDSKAPSRFWAEALSTAAYIRNRCPTKSVEGMTPIEALTGKKPDLTHLRRFGCAAYAHIPKEERQKLNPKTRKCILLGYGMDTKGYRLYDPIRGRVVICRDVIFNESDTPIENEEHNLYEDHDGTSGDSRVIIDWTDQEPETTTENLERDITHSSHESSDSGLRRSSRTRRQTEFYGEWVHNSIHVCDSPEPTSVKEALSGAEKEEWRAAMDQEFQSIEKNEVWKLESTLPKGKKAIGTKWVFKRKLNADGEIERYKARLVALGYSQQLGADYDDTFCPVVRFESVRTLIAIAVQLGLKLHQMDVTAAFLNGDLKEDVYLSPPEGLVVDESKNKMYLKLVKSLYGLRQSPRCWNSTLDTKLKQMGFQQTPSDPCIYVNVTSTKEPLILAVYVDDIILAGKNDEQISQVKEKLAQCFEVKDLGILHHFLGVKISYNKTTGSAWMGQSGYTEKVLEKFNMNKAKPTKTPVNSSSRLRRRNDGEEGVDKSLYQSVVGSLLYLATRTRPDISFAVSNVAKYCHDPSKEHWTAVKRILRYLKGSTHLGLLYTRQDPMEVVGYSDSDWGGDNDDHRSTSGYIFQIGGTAISWRSRKQSSVALSTAEAEYMALSGATQEAVWLRQLYTDLLDKPVRPTVIYEDNQACISMSENPKFHGRTKHINLKYHYIREQLGTSIELIYCPTNEMIADMFTKGLNQEKFIRLRSLCGIAHQPT